MPCSLMMGASHHIVNYDNVIEIPVSMTEKATPQGQARERELERTKRIYTLLRHRHPEDGQIFHAIAALAYREGRYEDALKCAERAVELEPGCSAFWNTLGVVREATESPNRAVEAYRRALSLEPDCAQTCNNLAIALQSMGDFDGAVAYARQATELDQNFARAHNTLGYALRRLGRWEEAAEALRTAIACEGDFAEAHNQLGVALHAMSRYEEAVQSYSRAIDIAPHYAEARWNRSLVQLLLGNLSEGLRDYHWRTHEDLDLALYPHHLSGHAWQGENFAGKKLLVHYEQGLGDTLHFCRYLPFVKERGGCVIFEVQEPLHAITKGLTGVDLLLQASAERPPSIDYDLHVSLMDLPRIFETSLDSVPAEVPYLWADDARTSLWRQRLVDAKMHIGIVWSGCKSYERNDVRSCRLADFAPLASLEGVALYSLQKGEPAGEIEDVCGSFVLVNLGADFKDFGDTAAAIANMDLVISVDTSVLHLAGAMGKPTWALICASPEWRWMLERHDSPWYPTMRLFRQKQAGQWTPVFDCLRRQLEVLMGQQGRRALCPEGTSSDTHLDPLEPVHAMASAVDFHRSGLKAYTAEQYVEATELMRQAVGLEPQSAVYHNSLGVALEAVEQFDEAMEEYERAAALQDDYAEPYCNMAILLSHRGQYEDAIDKCRRAIAHRTDHARAYHTMAYAQRMLGRNERAVENYRRAVEIKPDFPEAWNHLGMTLADCGRYSEAIAMYGRAIDLDPDYAEAHNNFGVVLRHNGDNAEAVRHYSEAVRLDPNFAEALFNLANALKDMGRCDEAISNYQRVIQITESVGEDPSRTRHGGESAAQATCDRGRTDGPASLYARAQWNLALALLLDGRFEQGWKRYRWRRRISACETAYPHCYDAPQWDGSPLDGRRLLLHYEQGFGDSIQFIRYAPLVKASGGHVVLEVRRPLACLFHRSLAVDEIVVASSDPVPADAFDVHASLLDLPGLFRTTPETIPYNVPYLHPDPAKVEYWEKRLCGDGLAVGVVWSGSSTHGDDRRRSCRLAEFEPLGEIDGLRLFGLQKGSQAAEADILGRELNLVNIGDEFSDFDDTAAAIANLDLVISVDTSVAHLAGAMGKPVWTLLPFSPDWRWMLERTDTPWYPTMRLFRQTREGRWADVFGQVAEQLAVLAARRNTDCSTTTPSQELRT